MAGLAAHVRGTLDATYAVGESGTAGPTGGSTPNRTPGYVAVAVVGPQDGRAMREVQTGRAERAGNMVAFAKVALELLRDVLEGSEKLDGGQGEQGEGSARM